MDKLEAALLGVMEGKAEYLSTILAAKHSDLIEASTKLSKLVLTRSSLKHVLLEWRSGKWTDNDVQQWASFVRRGHVPSRDTGPIFPVDTSYELIDEDLIVEVMARLDELGDEIDGEVGDEERNEMIRSLE